ncbi:hypothetical protein PGB28_16935 [Primorskyibacter aestuariivivens]|uniref:hypothetical protein n=1 Tax=Primorskyibacter aestuariivivens TaxID=1888912 RepID=UPI00230149C9|nr:hypothetical protein [Primorskyibacter aestuariivivens]MDA7430150.1 hypothetical protein [Primorskyibacter aestuariivivens]
MTAMETNLDAQPKTFAEALQLVQATPSLRKIKSFLDKSNLSADMKALLYDIARVTVKIGTTVIFIGRRIFEIASALASKFPNLTIGTLVGLVIATLLGGTLGAMSIAGATPFAGLAALLSKLVVLLGVGKGFIDDLRNNAAKAEMDRVSAQFNALGMGFVQS